MSDARPAPQHAQERKRLSAVDRLGLLSDERDERLDALVESAARATGFPVGLLSVVGKRSEVVRASYGVDAGAARERPRESSLAAWVVADGLPLAVEDVRADARADDALDLGCWAGVPLVHQGLPLGVLAVGGPAARAVDRQDLALLERLALVVVALLETRPVPVRAETPGSRKVRVALAAGQVEPVFQPIVRLDDASLHAVEALVAWRDDTARLPAGDQYLSVAEQGELSVAVHRELLAQASEQVHAWRSAYPSAIELRLSVNVSVRHLEQGDLVDVVRGCLQRSELDPAVLTLEITETALLRADERAVRSLTALRDEGVGIALDDFGTGYSSFSHLQRFPITQLKIDAAFVAGLGGDGPEHAVIEAVVGLADRLGLEVVAEGVSTDEQVRALRELGCRYGQGEHFSTPRRAATMDEFLLGQSQTASLDTWAEVLRRRRG